MSLIAHLSLSICVLPSTFHTDMEKAYCVAQPFSHCHQYHHDIATEYLGTEEESPTKKDQSIEPSTQTDMRHLSITRNPSHRGGVSETEDLMDWPELPLNF